MYFQFGLPLKTASGNFLDQIALIPSSLTVLERSSISNGVNSAPIPAEGFNQILQLILEFGAVVAGAWVSSKLSKRSKSQTSIKISSIPHLVQWSDIVNHFSQIRNGLVDICHFFPNDFQLFNRRNISKAVVFCK